MATTLGIRSVRAWTTRRGMARAASALVAASAWLLASVPARAQDAAPRSFTLGDPRTIVRRVQGEPQVVERLKSLGVEHWSYGRATVTFDGERGIVAGWNDPTGALKVVLAPRERPSSAKGDTIHLGDMRDDVVRRLGTPWAYARAFGGSVHLLSYGNSVIRVRASDLTVDAWVVRDAALPVAAAERTTAEQSMLSAATRPTPRSAAAPPSLRADVRWRDANGDGVVEGGERVTFSFRLQNEGAGRAMAVQPTIEIESPRGGLDPVSVSEGGDIAPRAERAFSVVVAAPAQVAASEIVVVAGAREGRGFDLAPSLRIRLPARASGAPRLVVRDVRVDDASRDGRIAPRELADVAVTIANDGDAPTPMLRARLLLGSDLFLAAGMPDSFALAPIAAGGTGTVSLSLYANARARQTDARLELADARGTIVARLALVLPVVAGGGSLAVDATARRDSSGTTRTTPPPARLEDVERDIPRAPALRPDAIAVIIGIERYRALPDARFATRDAALVRRYATIALGVPDDDEHLVVRTDAEASAGELRRIFGEDGWLARHVTANTELFVYFAGHGAPDASGRVPYLLPADADGAYVGETGIALGSVYDRLARLPARSITVALDACFSGLTRDRRALVDGTRPGTLSIEHPALLRRNMAVFAAARDAQAAGDLPDARHGAFTWYLARALRGEGDSDGDGAITVAELGRFLERGVSRAASALDREQRPLTIARDSMRVVSRVRATRGGS